MKILPKTIQSSNQILPSIVAVIVWSNIESFVYFIYSFLAELFEAIVVKSPKTIIRCILDESNTTSTSFYKVSTVNTANRKT